MRRSIGRQASIPIAQASEWEQAPHLTPALTANSAIAFAASDHASDQNPRVARDGPRFAQGNFWIDDEPKRPIVAISAKFGSRTISHPLAFSVLAELGSAPRNDAASKTMRRKEKPPSRREGPRAFDGPCGRREDTPQSAGVSGPQARGPRLPSQKSPNQLALGTVSHFRFMKSTSETKMRCRSANALPLTG